MGQPSIRMRVVLVAITALTFSGCASARLSLYRMPGLDLTRYHTYDWAPDKSLTDEPELKCSPFFLGLVQESVGTQLAARGYERTASGRPDLLIHYHVSVGDPLRIGGENEREGYCHDCQPPYVFWPGTLIIDLIDARENRLAWRGWIEGDPDLDIHDQETCAKHIDHMVKTILSKLPKIRRARI